jgi:MFS family permease
MVRYDVIFVMGVMMIGQITGPPLAGWVFDDFGSYQGAWFAFAGLVIVGTVSLLTTPSAGNTMQVANKLREHKLT